LLRSHAPPNVTHGRAAHHAQHWAGHPRPFSQWHAGAPFEKYGLRFPTAENWMMWRKAQLFGAPQEMLDAILAAGPAEARKLGRQVPGFVESVWQVAARPLVAEGNYAKFTQNPAALRCLLETASTTLVEASPWDRLWGIGLAAEDPRALSRATWRGHNWLGEVLTDIRDTLLAARSA
jgi:ribA/ribD-fused uncharacterized protein